MSEKLFSMRKNYINIYPFCFAGKSDKLCWGAADGGVQNTQEVYQGAGECTKEKEIARMYDCHAFQ